MVSKGYPSKAASKKGMARLAGATTKTRRPKAKEASYHRYHVKILRQLNPKMTLSATGRSVIDSMTKYLLETLSDKAGVLARFAKRQTMKTIDITNATRLVMAPDLAQHAIKASQIAVRSLRMANGQAV